jgi:hypothetical protein
MDTEGTLSPATLDAARERYESLGPTAQVVTREVAKAMGFDRSEYRDRVTDDVVHTAHDALFASMLEVNVGTREEFDAFRERSDYEVHLAGSEHVEHVAWHVAPFAGQVVAATFADERRAAVGTLRRIAFGRIYREALEDEA